MGNILAITDESGTIVVKYSYDPWGKITSTTGSMASTIGTQNPFKYKGYYYDTESRMYYCKSRYYAPEWGRWLNADSPDFLELEQCTNVNLMAYCGNNPVMGIDESGYLSNFAKLGIGAATIALIGILTVVCGGVPVVGVILGAAFYGALVGAAAGGAIGGAIGGINNASKGESVINGIADGIADGFMYGSIIGGAVGSAFSSINYAAGLVEISGIAQRTASTYFHRMASNIEAGKMAMQIGRYKTITLNRCLNTAGLKGRKIPDVIGVARFGSSIAVEVVSKSQTAEQMKAKLEAISKANNGLPGHVVKWAGVIARWFN